MRSTPLTIFEGPDGSGKSTAAQRYAELTGAQYVHFPAMPHVTKGLARMYVEAMTPALLGHQPVVFDRCWLSELPYGLAFRNGMDRLGAASCRMLERLAMRCGAVVVFCDPGWETVQENYMSRREIEMLENEQQLGLVYQMYTDRGTQLPYITHDYKVRELGLGLMKEIEALRMTQHLTSFHTAGNLDGKIAIVGENFAERKDNDPWYQWPFASFDKHGCSQWLTKHLIAANLSERDLFWLNADMDLELLHDLQPQRIISLGGEASSALYRLKINAISVPHPQYWKRFQSNKPYPLINYLWEQS